MLRNKQEKSSNVLLVKVTGDEAREIRKQDVFAEDGRNCIVVLVTWFCISPSSLFVTDLVSWKLFCRICRDHGELAPRLWHQSTELPVAWRDSVWTAGWRCLKEFFSINIVWVNRMHLSWISLISSASYFNLGGESFLWGGKWWRGLILGPRDSVPPLIGGYRVRLIRLCSQLKGCETQTASHVTAHHNRSSLTCRHIQINIRLLQNPTYPESSNNTFGE